MESTSNNKVMAAALCIGIAALAGTLSQSHATASAVNAISRNPAAEGRIFISMILGLALIESLVLFALVIAFQILGS
jgi:F-type H+-transporting ATPase subunit c